MRIHSKIASFALPSVQIESKPLTSTRPPAEAPLDHVDLGIAMRLRISAAHSDVKSLHRRLGIDARTLQAILGGFERPKARFVMDFCRVVRVCPHAIIGDDYLKSLSETTKTRSPKKVTKNDIKTRDTSGFLEGADKRKRSRLTSNEAIL